jgi:hypothetical protein
MREHHLDGTVLLRPGVGGIFEPLVRPDLLITDAERALVRNSRRMDRNEALIGKHDRKLCCSTLSVYFRRYHHVCAFLQTFCPHAL